MDALQLSGYLNMNRRSEPLPATALRPAIKGAAAIRGIAKPMLGDLHLMSLIDEPQVQAEAAIKGDLGLAEAMLMVQAHALDALFNELVRRATLNFEQHLQAAESY